MPTPTKRRRKTVKKPAREQAPLLRTSERTSFKRCRWQWDRNYNDRLRPHEEAPALRFGTLIHKALELRYPPGIKRGPKPAPQFEKLFDKELKEAEDTWGFRDSDGEWADAKQLGVNMLEHYVEVYGKDEEWKVLQSEMTFRVPVYTPEHPDGGYMGPRGEQLPKRRVLFYYVGTMDGVWQSRMDGGVWINDYKTTKNDPVKDGIGKLVLDEQGTAYWTWGVDWLIRQEILKPREQQALNGMLYTFLRKAKKDERPQNAAGHYLNKDGTVSKVQPGTYFHREVVYRDEQQQQAARERAVQEFLEMVAVRDGRMAAYKSPGTGYPSQQCNACPFFDICELHEIDADWESLRDASMTTWDPYDAHEIAEEGKAR